jgi:hypothetical protein
MMLKMYSNDDMLFRKVSKWNTFREHFFFALLSLFNENDKLYFAGSQRHTSHCVSYGGRIGVERNGNCCNMVQKHELQQYKKN